MNVAVAELGLAPGKSMRAQDYVESLDFDQHGMFGDRQYMWVESREHTNALYLESYVAQPGHFLSQREDPILTSLVPERLLDGVSIRSEASGESIIIHNEEDEAANRIPVSVWGWNGQAVDQGEEVAAWGEAHINRPVRLVAVSDQTPRYVENDPRLGRVGFADGYPLLVTSSGSVAAMNDYFVDKGRPQIPADRFRANIILDGLEAFGEDTVASFTVVSNGLRMIFTRMKACGRCPVPDTDQQTGERKKYVRSALGKLGRTGTHLDTAKYGEGREIFFGQNFIVTMPDEHITDGETLKVTRESLISDLILAPANWLPSKKVT